MQNKNLLEKQNVMKRMQKKKSLESAHRAMSDPADEAAVSSSPLSFWDRKVSESLCILAFIEQRADTFSFSFSLLSLLLLSAQNLQVKLHPDSPSENQTKKINKIT